MLILGTPVPYLTDRDNLYEQYLLLMFQRQQNHMRSVLRLGRAKESWLIARSAIEGAALMKWMALSPDDNAEKYKAISLRDQYTHTVRLKDIGIPQEKQFEFKVLFGQSGEHLFRKLGSTLTHKERKAVQTRERLKRSKEDVLEGETVRSFVAQQLGDYNTTSYWELFSEFHHWSPRSLQGLINSDSSVSYNDKTDQFAMLAMEAGFISLKEATLILDKRFKLSLAGKIKTLNTEFEAWCKKTPRASSL